MKSILKVEIYDVSSEDERGWESFSGIALVYFNADVPMLDTSSMLILVNSKSNLGVRAC